MGLGILSFLKTITGFYRIAPYIYFTTGIIAVLISIINFLDIFRFKDKGVKNIRLQLPSKVKKIIHFVIRKEIKSSYIILSSFICGIFISSLEFLCTGQIYLPTLIYIIRVEKNIQSKTFFYLLFYNFAFILPMVGIFLLAYYGFNSQKLIQGSLNSFIIVKFLISIILATLGIYLIVNTSLPIL